MNKRIGNTLYIDWTLTWYKAYTHV